MRRPPLTALSLGDRHVELVRLDLVVPARGTVDAHPYNNRSLLRVHLSKACPEAMNSSSAVSFLVLHGRPR